MRLFFLLMALLAATVKAEPPRVPVLVELFSSEGCSSCPPADELLREWSRTQPVPGVEIIPLELHVDYWNYLGWSDPFSQAAFSQRQQSYARALRLESTYTPQVIVDGARQLVGSDEAALKDALLAGVHAPRLPLTVTRTGNELHARLERAPPFPAELWVALTEANLSTQIRAGENRGRTLRHAPVVRQLTRLALVDAQHLGATFRLPETASPLTAVVFVQAPQTGHVLAAAVTR